MSVSASWARTRPTACSRRASEKPGHKAELANSTDCNQPNPALSSGDPGANRFQHVACPVDRDTASGNDAVVEITWLAVAVVIVFVQSLQIVGNRLARRVMRR